MKRKALANWTLLLVSTLLSLSMAEVGFRLWERHSLAVTTQLDGPRIHLGKLNYNDTTVPRSKSEGEYRILAFGDSFCYSIMAPSHSYCGLIAGRLNQDTRGPRVRVVNLGEPASTVTDYAAAYSFWGGRIEHDGVLFNIYLGNDLLDIAYRYTPAEWHPNRAFSDLEYHMSDGSRRSPVPHRLPLRMLDHAYALYLTATRRAEPNRSAAPHEHFNLAAGHNLGEAAFLETNRTQMVSFDYAHLDTIAEGYRAFMQLFRHIATLRRQGMNILVTLAPNEVQVDREFRERPAETYGLDLGSYDLSLPARTVLSIRDMIDPDIAVLDLAPFFVCASDRGEQLYYLTNTHWGPRGNALAAEVISAYLGHAWFGAPVPAADPCAGGYYARNATASDADIARFVQSLDHTEADRSHSGEAVMESAEVLPDLLCGSLDGGVIDEYGGVFLWGWAYDPRTDKPARGVILLDNGVPLPKQIPLGVERRDVVDFYHNPDLAAAGWNLRISPRELDRGEHLFTAVAVLADGKRCAIPDLGRARVVSTWSEK